MTSPGDRNFLASLLSYGITIIYALCPSQRCPYVAHDGTLNLPQIAVSHLPSILGEEKAIITSTGRIITPSTIVQLWREKKDVRPKNLTAE